MYATISTILDCPPERVWEEVQTTRLLRYVNRPLLDFEPLDPSDWPKRWEKGVYRCRMKLLGVLPLGKHIIDIRFPDAPEPGTYRVRDAGHGDLVKTWDHVIIIRPASDGTTDYTDRIRVEAGLLTPLIWAYAHLFYRHRQRRWRRLVARNFEYDQVNL